MDITAQQLESIHPGLSKFLLGVQNVIQSDALNTKQRLAHFLAQWAEETGGFIREEENLNYSAEGLKAYFHRHFTDDNDIAAYAHKPEKIANRVYANRGGNGDEASGDGWLFRGRGWPQLTFNNNYVSFSIAISDPNVVQNPDLVATPLYAVRAAGWYWNSRNLNLLADDDNIEGITRAVNGPAMLGLDKREAWYRRIIMILG